MRPVNLTRITLARLGETAYRFLEEVGYAGGFILEVIRSLRLGIRLPVLYQQIIEIGARSLLVVFLTGLFTGLVFALESSYAFRLFQAESLIGPSVTLSITRELAPVLTAIMVTARAGSAMATELATMRVTEQIDALFVMGLSPVNYLVLPRVLASMISLPFLTMFFNAIGYLASYAVTVYLVGVSPWEFTQQVLSKVDLKDLYSGIFKALVFGALLALTSTARGYKARGGARGVGVAATEAVVLSCVIILMADYLLTALIFGV
jgi:phospholipid/cholesterol/gamma-HCH transport system permease protein